MYEDIYNQIKLAAEKKNLKPSTANAYCHTIRHFLDYTGKPWNELIIDDADVFLNRKKVIWSHAGNFIIIIILLYVLCIKES